MRIGSWPRFKFLNTKTSPLLKSTVWTVGAYGVSSAVRLGTNVLLARLLAPELFGTMLIVYSLKFGIELISDVGIGQNIVYSKNAENPKFYNTAWSLQLMRSIALWAFFLAMAAPAAHFYRSPILVYVIPITGFGLVFSGFTSISRALLQKRLQTAKLVSFDTAISFLGSAGQVLLAYFSPTIWALAFGGLIGPAATMIGSYFLLNDVRQRFYISKEFAWEILHFGKWIFIASLVYYLIDNLRPAVFGQSRSAPTSGCLRHFAVHLRAPGPTGRPARKLRPVPVRRLTFPHAAPRTTSAIIFDTRKISATRRISDFQFCRNFGPSNQDSLRPTL